MKKIAKTLVYSIVTIFIVFSSLSGAVADDLRRITILHTNDNHSRLVPFDKPEIKPDIGGVARRAEYVRAVRKESPGALLLDAGDMFQGTPFFNFFKGEADVAAYSLCGYDAVAFGNHEPDYGFDNVFAQFEKASFPMICANVFREKDDRPAFVPYKIFERGGLRIAVTGIMGKDAWGVISKKLREGYYHADETGMLRNLVRHLRKRADLVVVLSHSGYDADKKLASSLSGIDLIIGSHSHTLVKAPELVRNDSCNGIGGTLVVQAFECGIFVGRVDLFVGPDGKIARYDGGLAMMDASIKVPRGSATARAIKRYDDEVKKIVSEKLGVSNDTMTNRADMFTSLDTPLGNFAGDAVRSESGADACIMNTTTLRDSVPKGPITVETVLKLIPFDNTVHIFEMKGSALAAGLDHIAANFGKIESMQYSGVSWTIDVAAKKARNITVDGALLDPEKTYKVATSSFIGEGNIGGDRIFAGASSKRDTGVNLRDAVASAVRKAGTVSAPPAGRIKLVK